MAQKKTKKRLKDLPAAPKKPETVGVMGKYTFTDKEKADMSKEMCKKSIDKSLMEDEKKSVMAGYKDKIDGLGLSIKKLSRNVYDGFEFREFQCTVEKDFVTKIKKFRDVDTKEIVSESPLSPMDYQHTMDEIDNAGKTEAEQNKDRD